MLYECIFDNKLLSDFGFYVAEYPNIDDISEVVEQIEVEGRNGSLTHKLGYYKDRNLNFKFRLKDLQDANSKVRNFKNMLVNFKDAKLIYDEEDKFYKVKFTIINSTTYEIDRYKEIDVTFVCEPFIQSVKLFETSSNSIKIAGDFDTKPLIRITGSGNIQISINNKTFQVKNVVNAVNIDCNLQLCYDDRKTIVANSGEYPVLQKGDNAISITSGSYVIKYREYWR